MPIGGCLALSPGAHFSNMYFRDLIWSLKRKSPMSIDKSLRRKNSLQRARNVLTRGERILVMQTEERWPANRSPYGLPKVRVVKVKKTKKAAKGPRTNPIAYVLNYLREVIGELRKVIWPNRKQMVTYTMVVLVFLAFMVTLIGLVDLGVAKVVMMVFG